MNFGDIVGDMLREGVSPATRQRVEHALGSEGLGRTGGLEQLLERLGSGASGSGGGLGGLVGAVGSMLGARSGAGDLSRGNAGGLGAIAGALLGTGRGAANGAAGGSAMALLGTLALSALKNWQAAAAVPENADGGAAPPAFAPPAVSAEEARQMTAPETAELCLLAMIEAAKADGHVGPREMEGILKRLETDGVTPEEQAFVREHMFGPPDPDGLVGRIPNAQVGAQVYAAALMAVSVDTEEERAFLARLAAGAGLDAATVDGLHRLTGAPPA